MKRTARGIKNHKLQNLFLRYGVMMWCAVFILAVGSAQITNAATTFTVSNTNNSGGGSLRQAILDANGTSGADIINFSTSGTITPSTPLPTITEQVSINGNTAPRSSRGDGIIDSADIVQTIRYLNELDAKQAAGGPTAPRSNRPSAVADKATVGRSLSKQVGSKQIGKVSSPVVAPELRVESTSGSAGNDVTVNIRVDAVGNESQYAFAVTFDPNVLSFKNFAAGETSSTNFSCNTTATAGRVRCQIGGFSNRQGNPTIGEIAPGDNQLLIKVIFTVAASAQGGTTTPVNLSDASAADDQATAIQPATTNGTVTIAGATAAAAAIGGRVVNQRGRGVASAQIVMTNSQGERRIGRTNASGYFKIPDVAAGETYTVTVKSKQYRFTPKVINVTQGLDDLNFTAQP